MSIQYVAKSDTCEMYFIKMLVINGVEYDLTFQNMCVAPTEVMLLLKLAYYKDKISEVAYTEWGTLNVQVDTNATMFADLRKWLADQEFQYQPERRMHYIKNLNITSKTDRQLRCNLGNWTRKSVAK